VLQLACLKGGGVAEIGKVFLQDDFSEGYWLARARWAWGNTKTIQS